MDLVKLNFISNKYTPLLKDLPAAAAGKWGKMNGQQMVEHVTGFFKVSTEKIKIPLVTPVEHLPKYKEFLLSDVEFRENTKAPGNIVPEEPVTLRNASIPDAKSSPFVLALAINSPFTALKSCCPSPSPFIQLPVI